MALWNETVKQHREKFTCGNAFRPQTSSCSHIEANREWGRGVFCLDKVQISCLMHFTSDSFSIEPRQWSFFNLMMKKILFFFFAVSGHSNARADIFGKKLSLPSVKFLSDRWIKKHLYTPWKSCFCRPVSNNNKGSIRICCSEIVVHMRSVDRVDLPTAGSDGTSKLYVTWIPGFRRNVHPFFAVYWWLYLILNP